jgi:lipoprotein signal peptidase
MSEQHAADRPGFRLAEIVSMAAATLLLDSLITYIVYRGLPLDRAQWLVEPVLYIAHDEHSAGAPGMSTELSSLAFLVGLIVVAGGIAYFAAAHCSSLVRIALGIAIGGALANAIEDILTGSVTDFVGISAIGSIWSAGDVSMWTAILVIGVAWAANPRAVAGFPRWMIIAVWGGQIAIDVLLHEQGPLKFAIVALVACLLAAVTARVVRFGMD